MRSILLRFNFIWSLSRWTVRTMTLRNSRDPAMPATMLQLFVGVGPAAVAGLEPR